MLFILIKEGLKLSEYIVKKAFFDMRKQRGFRVGEVFEETNQEKAENLKADGFLEDKEVKADNPPKLPEWPKHTGGGWYELSNGEKVQGKEEAVEAQAQLGE